MMREFLLVTIQEIWKLELFPFATLLSKLITCAEHKRGNKIKRDNIYGL